jgi:hypothetical protein
MVKLTAAAQHCLDEYLAEVRSCLRNYPSVDAADIEQDVAQHIEHALSAAPAPVDAPELRNVLGGLGVPSQWVPQEELNRFQRALLALRSGPDDLRLAYLSFGMLAMTLFSAACLNLLFGFATTLPFLVLALVADFLAARAALSVTGKPAKGERWLVYPSLITVYLPITAAALLWPLVAAIVLEAVLTDVGAPQQVLAWSGRLPQGKIALFIVGTIGSLWWSLLAFIAWRWPIVLRDCYTPFAHGFVRRRAFLILSVVLFLVSLVSTVLAVADSR